MRTDERGVSEKLSELVSHLIEAKELAEELGDKRLTAEMTQALFHIARLIAGQLKSMT